jgi:hypothetical protein
MMMCALLGREKQRQDRRTSCTRLAIRKNMRDRDRFDYVICQLAALKAFCFAVVASHPDRQTPGVCITAMEGQTLADLLVTPASDAMVAGVENMFADLTQAVRVPSIEGS